MPFLSTAERANPPRSKFFGIVTCPKTGLVELSHPLDQCYQARCHFRLSPLVTNQWQEQMLVRPLREDMHVNKKTLSGGTFPATLEGGVQVLLPTVAT
jgi:hypothetical protein